MFSPAGVAAASVVWCWCPSDHGGACCWAGLDAECSPHVASFQFGEAAPDAVFLVMPEAVVQTFLLDGALLADSFGFKDFVGGFASAWEPEVDVHAVAGAFSLPVGVGVVWVGLAGFEVKEFVSHCRVLV